VSPPDIRGEKGRAIVDKKIVDAVKEQAQEGKLSCGAAFRIAEDLAVNPLQVGEAADELEVQLYRCQLGLFGYNGEKRIVHPAESVAPELDRAIQEGLVVGRLPCAVAWALANRFDLSKLDIANAAEELGVRIGQCQLGAF